jgi:hypothetical protein
MRPSTDTTRPITELGGHRPTTGVSPRHADTGMTTPCQKVRRIIICETGKPGLTWENNGAALGSRTPDLRITMLTLRTTERSTSTDPTPRRAPRTPALRRTLIGIPRGIPGPALVSGPPGLRKIISGRT